MTTELVALLNEVEAGRVRRGPGGRLSFSYNDAWRQAADAYPLSLSMPLAAREHGHAAIEAFLWGLLPDNQHVLDRWAAKFQVSARNVFALIAEVGEDCAGAVQFIKPERIEVQLSGAEDAVEWLDEAAIAERLTVLRADHAAWRLPRDTGQFSLAGAQPKTALLFQGGRWGIPSGRIPTTHILKPPTVHFDGHAQNEHICLMLARALGLPTAQSRVMRFGDETAIVVERYDRQEQGIRLVRVHQEDICQSLSVMPTKKYQNEGGPGPLDIIGLINTYSTTADTDLDTFVGSMAFNWLIAGTDAHAKNFSLLLGARQVRLAPLYDVASLLPYDRVHLRKIKLAMKIGDTCKLDQIGLRQWQKFASDARLDEAALVDQIVLMASQLPDELRRVVATANEAGFRGAIIDRLVAQLVERAEACRRALGAA